MMVIIYLIHDTSYHRKIILIPCLLLSLYNRYFVGNSQLFSMGVELHNRVSFQRSHLLNKIGWL